MKANIISNIKRNFIYTLITAVFVLLGLGIFELFRAALWAFYEAGFVM